MPEWCRLLSRDGYPHRRICVGSGTGTLPSVTAVDKIYVRHSTLARALSAWQNSLVISPVPAEQSRKMWNLPHVWAGIAVAVSIAINIGKRIAAVDTGDWSKHGIAILSGVPLVMAYVPALHVGLKLPRIYKLSVSDVWRCESPR